MVVLQALGHRPKWRRADPLGGADPTITGFSAIADSPGLNDRPSRIRSRGVTPLAGASLPSQQAEVLKYSVLLHITGGRDILIRPPRMVTIECVSNAC